MTFEEHRNLDRINDMNKLFDLLRRMKKCREITDSVYKIFKSQLVDYQIVQTKMRELVEKTQP